MGVVGSSKTQLIKKQQWFDWECLKLRNESFKKLKIWRTSGNQTDKHEYLKTNKIFKTVCQDKCESFTKNIALTLDSIKTGKDFWAILSKFKNCNKFSIDPKINVNLFSTYFSNLLNQKQTSEAILYAEPEIFVDMLDDEFRFG